jgi:hypothetical protein
LIWLQLGLVLALVAGVVFAVDSYNSAIEDAETQKALAAKVTKERDGWIDVVVVQEAAKVKAEEALKAREVDRARLQKERDDARASAATVKRDPAVRAWADVELPGPVLQRLRNLSAERPAAKDDSGKAPGDAPRGNARPEVRRIP